MIFSGMGQRFNTKSAWSAVIGLIAATLVAAAILLHSVSFRADIDAILPMPSAERAQQTAFERSFPDLFQTTTLAIQAPDLDPVLDPLEGAVLDLWLAPGVTHVTSILSLSPAAMDPGSPLLGALMSPDRTLTLVTVSWADRASAQDREQATQEFARSLSPFAQVTDISPAAVSAATAQALQTDQTRLLGISVAVCLALAVWLMGGWRAAVTVTVPPLLGVVWAVAAVSALGVALNPLLMIVPTILLVLGAADALHFAHAMALHGARLAPAQAAWAGMRQTLPAAAATSLSTALAFGMMALFAPTALTELALFGLVGLAAQLLAVAAGTTALHAVLAPPPPPVRAPGKRLIRGAQALLRHHRPVAALAIGAVLVTAMTLPLQRATHDLRSALPDDAPLTLLLEQIDTQLAGADRLFLTLPAADPAPGVQQADADRLSRLMQSAFGPSAVLPTDLNAGLEAFGSRDGSTLALPVPAPLLASSDALRAHAAALVSAANAALPGLDIQITGTSLTAAVEMPDLLWRVSAAFYATAMVMGALAWIVLGSLRSALAFMLPNLLTLLSVSALFVLTGQPLSMTGAIVMTVAFGIAVDDTIHLVHRLRHQRRGVALDRTALSETVAQAGPPVIRTTALVAAGFATLLISSIPAIQGAGLVLALATVLALLYDLYVLPSLLVGRQVG